MADKGSKKYLVRNWDSFLLLSRLVPTYQLDIFLDGAKAISYLGTLRSRMVLVPDTQLFMPGRSTNNQRSLALTSKFHVQRGVSPLANFPSPATISPPAK